MAVFEGSVGVVVGLVVVYIREWVMVVVDVGHLGGGGDRRMLSSAVLTWLQSGGRGVGVGW